MAAFDPKHVVEILKRYHRDGKLGQQKEFVKAWDKEV